MKSNNKFFRNTSWILFSQIFYLGLSFVVSVYAARILGPENIGIMDLSNNYISMLLVIGSLGIDAIVINDIVNQRDPEGNILGSAFGSKLIAAIFMMILLNLFFFFTQSKQIFIICLVQSFVLVFKLYSVYDLYYQSKLESKVILKTRSIISGIMALVKILVLSHYPSLLIYAMLTTIEHLICFCAVSYNFRRTNVRLVFSVVKAKELLLEGYHFILSDLLVMIYTRIDKIMLATWRGTTELGIYSVATMLSDLWVLLPNAIITSARPVILELRDKNHSEYEKKLKQLYCVLFYLGSLVSIFMAVFSKWIIALLYGSEYIKAAEPVAILSFSSVFAILGSARSIWIISENLQKYTKVYIGTGAIINVILNFMFINTLGMMGVAYATLITQISVAIVVPLFISKTRRSSILILEAIMFRGVK